MILQGVTMPPPPPEGGTYMGQRHVPPIRVPYPKGLDYWCIPIWNEESCPPPVAAPCTRKQEPRPGHTCECCVRQVPLIPCLKPSASPFAAIRTCLVVWLVNGP